MRFPAFFRFGDLTCDGLAIQAFTKNDGRQGVTDLEKHILVLTTTNDFLSKFERENVKLLQQRGYTVHYAANMEEPHYISDKERIEKMGVEVHPIEIARSPFLLRNNKQALEQVVRVIRDHGISVLHCHTPVGGVVGRLAGRLCRRRPVVIYTAHGFHFYKEAPLWNQLVYYQVEKQLARYTDILIVINEEDYRNAQRFRLRRGGRLYKIPGVGLDTAVFRPLSAEERRQRRDTLGMAQDAFFLVSVGELNENKNHKVILEALAKIRRLRGEMPPILYGICGDGFYRERMERWIVEMGLKDVVTLYGYCRDVPQILGCADALAFPSKREGLGMAGLEALAMGVPVLAADNRGTREYMQPGKNGFVCPYDDVDGFVRGIERLRAQDDRQREAMRAYCRDSVRPFEKSYAIAAMRRIYTDVDRRVEHAAHERQGDSQYTTGRIQPR